MAQREGHRPCGADSQRGHLIRILALGDSYTAGEGIDAALAWPAVVARALSSDGTEVETLVIAETGWTVDELLSAIDEAGTRGPFGAVTIGAGVNDQYRGLPVDGYARDARRMIARAIGLADGAPSRVVVISIPDWSVTPHAADRDRAAVAAEIDAFNSAARAAAREAGTAWVDLTTDSRRAGGDAALLAPDGLHASAALHELWARRIARPLARALG